MNKAVFLDRDGTINEEVNYLYKKEDLAFIPRSIEAIRIFNELGFKTIVITNQAGVARGYYSENDIANLHHHMNSLMASEGAHIDAYYYCPHHPEGSIEFYKRQCTCRKPDIGMIEKAAQDFEIDLRESVIIGDKEIDILTGKKAGIGTCVLVRSGHQVDESVTVADMVFDNMFEFAVSFKNSYSKRDNELSNCDIYRK